MMMIVVLISINLVMPISKIDENMKRAQVRLLSVVYDVLISK